MVKVSVTHPEASGAACAARAAVTGPAAEAVVVVAADAAVVVKVTKVAATTVMPVTARVRTLRFSILFSLVMLSPVRAIHPAACVRRPDQGAGIVRNLALGTSVEVQLHFHGITVHTQPSARGRTPAGAHLFFASSHVLPLCLGRFSAGLQGHGHGGGGEMSSVLVSGPALMAVALPVHKLRGQPSFARLDIILLAVDHHWRR